MGSTVGAKSNDGDDNSLLATIKQIYDLEPLQDPDHYIPSLSLGVTDFNVIHKENCVANKPYRTSSTESASSTEHNPMTSSISASLQSNDHVGIEMDGIE